MNKIDIKCPNCNEKIRAKIYNEITEDKIPSIIDDSLFKVKCKKCDKEIKIDYPIKLETTNYILTYNIKEIESSKKTRITESYNDFREKVIIFNDDLNDILIEFLKDYIIRNMSLVDKEIRYDSMNEENLIFTIIGEQNVGINIKFYNELLNKAKIKDNKIIDSNTYIKYIKL